MPIVFRLSNSQTTESGGLVDAPASDPLLDPLEDPLLDPLDDPLLDPLEEPLGDPLLEELLLDPVAPPVPASMSPDGAVVPDELLCPLP